MTRRAWIALAIDVAAVIVFVAIGRRSHDESGSVIAGALRVATPFLIGLGAGWLVARAWQGPMAVPSGGWIWATTVIVGLVLRRTVFDRGVAFAFVLVATITLAIFVVGWRLVARQIESRRGAPEPKDSVPAAGRH
jgi:hypothetical protein